MSVEWSEGATRQIQAEHSWIARTSPARADALAERIIERTVSLETNPRLGAEVPEYGDDELRELFEHPYRILYRLDGENVQIVAIIHASRRLPTNPPR